MKYVGLTAVTKSTKQSSLWKLIAPELVKKVSELYEAPRFTSVFKRARHLPFSWARSIQSTASLISWRSVLRSCHLCLGLPSCRFPSGFVKACIQLYFPPYLLGTGPFPLNALDSVTITNNQSHIYAAFSILLFLHSYEDQIPSPAPHFPTSSHFTLYRCQKQLPHCTRALPMYVLCRCISQYSRWDFVGMRVGFAESDTVFFCYIWVFVLLLLSFSLWSPVNCFSN